VAVATKKIRRPRAAGELAVEQTRDLASVIRMLTAAGMSAEGVETPGACYLIAHVGDEVAGVIGIESRVDSALLRSLMVKQPMRGRGIGASLIAAARTAAHTRGARTLYALAPDNDAIRYLERFGFTSALPASLLASLSGTFTVNHLRDHPDELARQYPMALDIANDGVILR
jgi:N-acetylglutamate synthase-like GNAT family acetyltransferase